MSYQSLCARDLFQLCAGRRDSLAWEEFLRRYQKSLAGVAVNRARRYGILSADVVQELLQEVYLKLCSRDGRVLRDFVPAGPDSEFSYLKVVAEHVIADWFRRRSAELRDPRAEISLNAAPFLDQADEDSCSLDRGVLIRQVERALADLATKRDRAVFWLYYRAGLTAKDIARFRSLELGPKGVESAVARMTRALRERFREDNLAEGKKNEDSFS